MAAVGYIYYVAQCHIPQAQTSYSPPWKPLFSTDYFEQCIMDHTMQKKCQKSTRYTHICIFHDLYGLHEIFIKLLKLQLFSFGYHKCGHNL